VLQPATHLKYIENNASSMYVNHIQEKEIIDFENKCKSKASTDCDDPDMKTIKRVIEGTVFSAL